MATTNIEVSRENVAQASRIVKISGAGLLALLIAANSYYTIDQSERGVLLRNGGYIHTADPGLHFKIPFIDKVAKISTQTHTYTYNKVNSYSADQQPADLKLSVTLHIAPERVSEIYARFGSLENAVARAISPHIMQQSKVVFGQYTAVRAIQERGKLNAMMRDALNDMVKDDPVFVIEGVQIENIDFSHDYIRSVEQRMQAEVEVQKLQQQALQAKVQAEITVTKARADADSLRANAQARADATRLAGEAEASAIRARGQALRDNPDLIKLVQAERWNGTLPTTVLPSTTLPIINVGP